MHTLYVFLATGLAMALSTAAEDKIVCYYGSWASGRSGIARVNPHNMDASLCTHFIWSFVLLSDNPQNPQLNPVDNAGNLRAFVQLREKNPAAKILIAVGGYTDSQRGAKYSAMAASAKSRKSFIDSVMRLLEDYNLDGFDVDWEYPERPADKNNFVLLLKELSARLKPRGYLLTAAVGASPWRVDTSYHVKMISQYLDFINLMTYDFHGSWEQNTGHHAALRGALSVESCVKYWLNQGCPPEKLVVGIPTYGKTWTLSNPQNHGIGASGWYGIAGPYTGEVGSLGYTEICEGIKKKTWTVHFDSQARAPYAHMGNQWVSYDNVESVTEKVNYIKNLRLGGAMIWSIETDDTTGACGPKFPILKAINAVLRNGGHVESSAPELQEFPEESAQSEWADNSYPDEEQQPSANSSTGECMAEGSFPDPNSCGFFVCWNDNQGGFQRAYQACPAGLCYDDASHVCNWPKQ